MRPAGLVLVIVALLEGPLGLAQDVTKQGEQVFHGSLEHAVATISRYFNSLLRIRTCCKGL
jgi:hypothetical protein